MTTPTQVFHFAEDFPAANIGEWRALVEKALKGAEFDKRLVSRTADGVKINPLYTRADTLQSTANELPGTPPFARGTKAVRDGLGWDIRTFHIESDPKAANAAILEDLEGGVTSIGLQVGGNGLPATREAIGTAIAGVLLDVCPVVLVAGENTFDARRRLGPHRRMGRKGHQGIRSPRLVRRRSSRHARDGPGACPSRWKRHSRASSRS